MHAEDACLMCIGEVPTCGSFLHSRGPPRDLILADEPREHTVPVDLIGKCVPHLTHGTAPQSVPDAHDRTHHWDVQPLAILELWVRNERQPHVICSTSRCERRIELARRDCLEQLACAVPEWHCCCWREFQRLHEFSRPLVDVCDAVLATRCELSLLDDVSEHARFVRRTTDVLDHRTALVQERTDTATDVLCVPVRQIE